MEWGAVFYWLLVELGRECELKEDHRERLEGRCIREEREKDEMTADCFWILMGRKYSLRFQVYQPAYHNMVSIFFPMDHLILHHMCVWNTRKQKKQLNLTLIRLSRLIIDSWISLLCKSCCFLCSFIQFSLLYDFHFSSRKLQWAQNSFIILSCLSFVTLSWNIMRRKKSDKPNVQWNYQIAWASIYIDAYISSMWHELHAQIAFNIHCWAYERIDWMNNSTDLFSFQPSSLLFHVTHMQKWSWKMIWWCRYGKVFLFHPYFENRFFFSLTFIKQKFACLYCPPFFHLSLLSWNHIQECKSVCVWEREQKKSISWNRVEQNSCTVHKRLLKTFSTHDIYADFWLDEGLWVKEEDWRRKKRARKEKQIRNKIESCELVSGLRPQVGEVSEKEERW